VFDTVRVTAGPACRPDCPVVIVASGDIALDTPDRFSDFLRRSAVPGQTRNVVLVHSAGGNVAGALRLGQIWRQLGTTVIVARPVGATSIFDPDAGRARGLAPAHCASACVFALMGARRRIIPDRSLVAVHQTHRIFFERDAADMTRVVRRVVGSDAISDQLRAYARAMGVRTELVSLAQSTPPTRIRVLSKAEMRRFGLANTR
jgi:hypothetical protein